MLTLKYDDEFRRLGFVRCQSAPFRIAPVGNVYYRPSGRARLRAVSPKGAFMNAEVAAFLEGLKTGTPPAAAVSLVRAVWYGLHGEWEAAHQISQDDSSAEGACVHAWLHRIEGDLDNARYWYRRAQRDVAEGDLREEGKTIAAFLLK